MIDLFILLELCTEEQGNWDMEFNPHKSSYSKAYSEYYSEDFNKNELAKIDFSKDIYRLRWYQHTQVGFYDCIANDVNGIINQVLKVLDVPECFLTPVADSAYFHGKYILVHPLHEPIAIGKGGIIEPIICLDKQPEAITEAHHE